MKEFEYVTKINGKFTKVPCMQDCINAISIRYEDALGEISRLEETNKKYFSRRVKPRFKKTAYYKKIRSN